MENQIIITGCVTSSPKILFSPTIRYVTFIFAFPISIPHNASSKDLSLVVVPGKQVEPDFEIIPSTIKVVSNDKPAIVLKNYFLVELNYC